jgi:cytochrome P450
MSASESSSIAPGPPGHFLFGHLREFRRDVLALLLRASRRYGDIVRFRLGHHVVHLVNHPEFVEQVLRTRSSNYDKETRSARSIRNVCGESLLTSNGASWQCQRKLLQPFFHGDSVKRFSHLMLDATLRMLDSWKRLAERGQPVDVAAEMMQVTYGIAAKAFFNAESGPEAQTIERAMEIILPYTFSRLERAINLPGWFPSPRNLSFKKALRSIDEIVYRIIERHRPSSEDDRSDSDLLAMLLAAQGENKDPSLSDRRIRDQTITFLLAGHETTSNALTWTFHLLGQHPEAQNRLRGEVRFVLGSEPPTPEHLARLPFLRQVVREALRLYPPIWIIERRVIQEDTIGGFRLPAESAVVVCPFTLHRHPKFWEAPDEFHPERFADSLPPAYIPFGAGARYCIGSEFALLEAQLVTAMVVREFSLSPVPQHVVQPWPGITLRTRTGLPMTLTSVGKRSAD